MAGISPGHDTLNNIGVHWLDMTSINKRCGGSSLLVIIASVAAIIGAGLIGHAIYDKQHKPPPNSTSQTTNGMTGWRSYTLKVEKLSFKYPPNWTVEDDTQAATGMDSVAINSPHAYFQISVGTGLGVLSADPDLGVIGADPINFAGQSDYLVYNSIEQEPTIVIEAYLSTSPTDYTAEPAARYAKDKVHNLAAGRVQILVGYNSDSGSGGKVFGNLAVTERDPNYIIAKRVIASMRY